MALLIRRVDDSEVARQGARQLVTAIHEAQEWRISGVGDGLDKSSEGIGR